MTEPLLARIAEEEAEARAALDDLNLDGTGTGWSTSPGYEHNQLSAPGYVFTRRWSPERVLAECEAKRRIVENLLACQAKYDATPNAYSQGARDAYLMAATFHARTYSAHPDHRAERTP